MGCRSACGTCQLARRLPPRCFNRTHSPSLHPTPPLRHRKVAKSGILLRSAPPANPAEGEACGRFGAALLFDWRHRRLDMVGVSVWQAPLPCQQEAGMKAFFSRAA